MDVFLDQPPVVNNAGRCAQVDELMQTLPAPAAKTADPAGSRCDCQRDEQEKAGESDSDEFALGDIGRHCVDVKKFVQPDVSKKMQHCVEKSEQAKHPAKANQPKLASQLADGSDGQSHQQEDQRPIARGMGDDFDGIGAEQLVVGLPPQAGKRAEAGEKNYDFEPTNQ